MPKSYHEEPQMSLYYANVSSCSALNAWLRRALTNTDSNPPQFVPVPNLLSVGRGSAAYRLQWSDGFTVEVSTGFAVQELSALLKTVQRL